MCDNTRAGHVFTCLLKETAMIQFARGLGFCKVSTSPVVLEVEVWNEDLTESKLVLEDYRYLNIDLCSVKAFTRLMVLGTSLRVLSRALALVSPSFISASHPRFIAADDVELFGICSCGYCILRAKQKIQSSGIQNPTYSA